MSKKRFSIDLAVLIAAAFTIGIVFHLDFRYWIAVMDVVAIYISNGDLLINSESRMVPRNITPFASKRRAKEIAKPSTVVESAQECGRRYPNPSRGMPLASHTFARGRLSTDHADNKLCCY